MLMLYVVVVMSVGRNRVSRSTGGYGFGVMSMP